MFCPFDKLWTLFLHYCINILKYKWCTKCVLGVTCQFSLTIMTLRCINFSYDRAEPHRTRFRWKYRWSKTYRQVLFYNSFVPKSPPPYNIRIYKGEVHGLFSQRFVEYIVSDERAKKLLEWCEDSGHASEHYWNTLNYNVHLRAPGGYTGKWNMPV